jgi:hypothetical protein
MVHIRRPDLSVGGLPHGAHMTVISEDWGPAT